MSKRLEAIVKTSRKLDKIYSKSGVVHCLASFNCSLSLTKFLKDDFETTALLLYANRCIHFTCSLENEEHHHVVVNLKVRIVYQMVEHIPLVVIRLTQLWRMVEVFLDRYFL